MSVNKFTKDPLSAILVGTLVAAMVASFVVFVQSGEAVPREAADAQPHSASVSPMIVGGTAVPNGKYPFVAYVELYKGKRVFVDRCPLPYKHDRCESDRGSDGPKE